MLDGCLYSHFARRHFKRTNPLDFPLPAPIAAALPSDSQYTGIHTRTTQVTAFALRVIGLDKPIHSSQGKVDTFAAAWVPAHVLKHMRLFDGSWVTIGFGQRYRRACVFATESDEVNRPKEKQEESELTNKFTDLYDDPHNNNAVPNVEEVIFLSPALIFNLLGLGVDVDSGVSVAVYPYGHPFSPVMCNFAVTGSSMLTSAEQPALAEVIRRLMLAKIHSLFA